MCWLFAIFLTRDPIPLFDSHSLQGLQAYARKSGGKTERKEECETRVKSLFLVLPFSFLHFKVSTSTLSPLYLTPYIWPF